MHPKRGTTKGRSVSGREKRSACPVACVLDLIGDRWTLLIIRDLACGKTRFAEFVKSPERIATNILADRLERLVQHDLAERFTEGEDQEKGPREGYRLTDKGMSLMPVLGAMADWGLEHIPGTRALLRPNVG